MSQLLDKSRAFIQRTAPRLFSTPYLPGGLIWLALGLALTDAALLLATQPAVYWREFSLAEAGFGWARALLVIHPLALVGAAFAYLLLLAALLGLLTRGLALVIWLPVALMHTAALLTRLAIRLNLQPADSAQPLALVLAGLLLGLALSLLLLRPRRTGMRWLEGPRALRWQSLLAVAWLALMASFALWQSLGARQGWQPVLSEHTPGKRWCAAGAYHAATQTGVLFGGSSLWAGNDWDLLNETWLWDGQDWHKAEIVNGPGFRRCAAMAYDPLRKVVVLFGGMTRNSAVLNDTWEWDGQSWLMIGQHGSLPPARSGHQMFYDPQSQRIIIAGGYGGKVDEDTHLYNEDSWAWNGQYWDPLPLGDEQRAVDGYAAAYDPGLQGAIALSKNSMLLWHGGSWEPVSYDPQPTPRYHASMAADGQGNIVLFGGKEEDTWLNDTWLFRDGRWQSLQGGLAPAGREGAVMFYDEARASFMVFGGFGEGIRSDMWALKLQP